MWPWNRRVEVVLASSAGDDATATLSMILRYQRKPVTFDEVRQAIYQEGIDVPSAAHVVDAAARFRVRGRGVVIEHPIALPRIPTPNIAHMLRSPGRSPRSRLEEGIDGYFAVVASASPRRVRWINPYLGQLDDEPATFWDLASGIFLMFDEADPLPRASIRPVASE